MATSSHTKNDNTKYEKRNKNQTRKRQIERFQMNAAKKKILFFQAKRGGIK